MNYSELAAFLENNHNAVLATFRANGAAQMSIVTVGLLKNSAAFSTTEERAKLKNLKRKLKLHLKLKHKLTNHRMIVMNSLPFKKFRKQLDERRYSGPEGTEEFKNLSPKLRKAINDVYNAINSTKGSIVSKIEGIVSKVAKKHGVKETDIEDYFDNELIK